jgi:hypothetical protein
VPEKVLNLHNNVTENNIVKLQDNNFNSA